jgi:hypothetical protein
MVPFLCDSCFVEGGRVPENELKCCNECKKFAKEGAAKIFKAAKPYVWCSGCDKEDNLAFKRSAYKEWTQAKAEKKMNQYLKSQVCGAGMPGTTGAAYANEARMTLFVFVLISAQLMA